METANLPLADFGRFTASRLCLGCLTMSPLQANLSPQEGAELIVHAHRLGVDFLDTADLYGAYPHIALALRSLPHLHVSTKCYAYNAQTAHEALERSFAIGREYIDVMMLHEQESEHTLRGHQEALDFFLDQKARGTIGCVGISTHRVEGVRAAARWKLDIVHPLVNMRGVGIQDGTIEDMIVACADARKHGVRVLGMKALGGGHLIGEALSAMRWAWAQPFLDGVAVGMKSFAEIEWHVAVARGKTPDDDLGRRVSQTSRRLFIHDWCAGCGACVRRCGQNALTVCGGQAVVDHAKCILCGYCAPECKEFCIKVL